MKTKLAVAKREGGRGWAKQGRGIKGYKRPVIKERSHGDEKYGLENIVNNVVVTDGNHVLHGELNDRTIRLLCFTRRANITVYVNGILIKQIVNVKSF